MYIKIPLQLVFFFFLCNISLNTLAQSPGGVSTGIRMWLKANAGTSTTTNNATISQWNDQSGNNRHATQTTASQRPGFKNNNIDNMNFNEVVDFTAANSNNFSLPTSVLANGTGAFSIYVVSRKNSNNGMTMMGLGSSSNNRSINVGTNGASLGRFHTWNNAWSPSAPLITNAAVIQSSYNFVSGTRYLSVNSVSYGSSAAPINLLAGGAYLGSNHNSATAANFEGEIAEVIVYANNSSAADKLRIESYLSMKYGITKSGNYVNSANTVIWNATTNSTYHNNVAIIGRDDGSALIQKQSKSSNTGFQPVIGNGSIAAANNTNASTFSVNQSFLSWGSNTGATTFSISHQEGNRMARIWKVQQTGTIGTVKVGVRTVDVPGVNFLSILISNDAVFDASDTRYQMEIETIGGINYFTTNVVLTNGQHFSFMSSDVGLPVDLVRFQADCNENNVKVTWQTASEHNSSHFIIEKSSDANNWHLLENISAAGNSNILLTYSVLDQHLTGDIHYYRLIQYDFDGKNQTFPVISSACMSSPTLHVFPNPSSDHFSINYNSSIASDYAKISLIDYRGETVFEQFIKLHKGMNNITIEGLTNPPGIYIIQVSDGSANLVMKRHVIR
ncbi:MAG: T9SS type A sorting domain-containing protein [Cytophagaceae bacterium]